MDDKDFMDKALTMLSDHLGSMEGSRELPHEMEDCPDPLGCDEHSDMGMESHLLSDKGPLGDSMEEPKGVVIEVEKHEPMEMSGSMDKDEMSPEEEEILRKLLS